MTYKNINQLKKDYHNEEFKYKFKKIFELSLLFKGCIFYENFRPPDILSDAIALTPYGETFADFLRNIDDSLTTSEIKFLLFLQLFYEDILIDVSKTEEELLEKALDDEIIRKDIHSPWIYDTTIYDKFYNEFGQGRETLSFEDVKRLLEGTPEGVFQVGEYLIGPLGLLKSSHERMLPPPRKFPLWHCPDPGCSGVHSVRLLNEKNKFQKLLRTLHTKMESLCAEPSQFERYYSEITDKRRGYYDEIMLKDFILYLGNCFDSEELKSILKKMIDVCSKEIRPLFPSKKNIKNAFNGNSIQITNDLDKSRCLQLILLLSDEQIVRTIESLIDENVIEIPATETRTPKNQMQFDMDGFNSIIQCSRNGIRSISNTDPIASIRLRKLIQEIYDKTNGMNLLGWKLRTVEGETLYEKLDIYMHSESPEVILSNLVLDDPTHLKTALNYIKFGKFDYDPTSIEEERIIIGKLLWKIGFDINIYPDYINNFWDRYEKFEADLFSVETHYKEAQESIRSSAVNFFVSLEQILGYSLSFMTWVLLSDHFGSTKFKLNLNAAQEFMASILTNATDNTNKLIYDPMGKNTLYPLIEGFSILANISSRMITDCENFKRNAIEIPEYFAGNYSKISFPFLHKMLVLDIREKDRDRALGLLKEITESLTRAEVCSIRNRIEHSREKREFPNKDEIARMCKTVNYIIREMINFGACPLIYYITEMKRDRYNRTSLKMTDCNGRESLLSYSYHFHFCNLPGFSKSKPFVLIPRIHIGDSAELIRFEFEETSKFTEMWRNYPKKGI